jgi:hypothetical protein
MASPRIRDELLLDRDVADHKHVAWLYSDHAAPPEDDGGPRAA